MVITKLVWWLDPFGIRVFPKHDLIRLRISDYMYH